MTQPPRLCDCGCGRSTRGGRFLPGHNIVALNDEVDKATLFWSQVKYAPDGCRVWTGCKFPSGYGAMRWKGKPTGTHRIAYELVNGPIGDGVSVLHECDNRLCCNPEHLTLGSQSDNMRGAAIRQRMPKDLKHHRAKPIQWRGYKHTAAEWARQLGVSKHALISRLKRGWSHERAFTTPVQKK